ncbi:hypothetical protein [Neisseria bergeri]|uniref:hypothetical protein n=1 Tax=Neisseria bergeri TaxID=1906581 RepID=UPI0027DFE5D6|nr:hypothetical protein [Neisseria bergeri]
MPSEHRDGWDCANAATPPPSCTIRTRRILPHCLIFTLTGHLSASDGISGGFLPAYPP